MRWPGAPAPTAPGGGRPRAPAGRAAARDLIARDDHDLPGVPCGAEHGANTGDRGLVGPMPSRSRTQRRDVAQIGLLDVFGQQQYRRAAAPGGGHRPVEAIRQVGGVFHPCAIGADRAEEADGIDGARASAGVLERAVALQEGRRLPDQCEDRHPRSERFGKSGDQIHRATARGRRDHAESAGGTGVTVGHGGRGELVFGDHPGHVVRRVEDRVVEVLDVGAVHSEDVSHPQCRNRSHQIVHGPSPHRPSLPLTKFDCVHL